MRRIAIVMARPMSGSATVAPRATAPAVTITAAGTRAAARAGGPAAVRAPLPRPPPPRREPHRLRRRGDAEHRERDAHRTQPLARALDRVVHEPVAMPMPIRMGVPVGVFMLDMRATHDLADGTQPCLGRHHRHTQAW